MNYTDKMKLRLELHQLAVTARNKAVAYKNHLIETNRNNNYKDAVDALSDTKYALLVKDTYRAIKKSLEPTDITLSVARNKHTLKYDVRITDYKNGEVSCIIGSGNNEVECHDFLTSDNIFNALTHNGNMYRLMVSFIEHTNTENV